MLTKIKSFAKEPAFWVILVVVAIAVTAFSALRKPFKGVAAKLPGSDAAGT